MTVDDLTWLPGGQLSRVMELARRHLGMDLVCLSEFVQGRQVFQALVGDAESFGLTVGTSLDLDQTYCSRMVAGLIPMVIPDSAADARVRDLPETPSGTVRSYLGVPIRLADGSIYGTFCCLNSAPDPALQARDVNVLRLLADLVSVDLDGHSLRQRQEIEDVISQEQVTVALQPVVDLATGQCVIVEALARFASQVPPDHVFAEAHRLGLGLGLERVAARRALQLLPVLGEGQALGLNASPVAALSLAAIRGIVSHPALPRVLLEITEHAAVESYVALRDRLRPLRERGLRLAIDDAGAGYASLHHIIELAPDVIKIDRSIVHGLAEDAARRSVVRSLVGLARDLGALSIAEGVERRPDLEVAAELGVDAAQGFLLARPTTDRAEAARWAGPGSLLADSLPGLAS